MSHTSVFAFIEGKSIDPYFYGKLTDAVPDFNGFSRDIVRATSLQESGGKGVLTDFYQFLLARNSLMMCFQGKITLALFFLDKDIDDVLNRRLFSEHVIYTEYYSVENYLFREGRLSEAIAAACSFEPERTQQAIGSQAIWLKSKASFWKDWLIYCVLSQKLGIVGQGNFSRNESPLNRPIDTLPDTETLALHESKLISDSGLSDLLFQRKLAGTTRYVNSLYSRDLFDRIYKGRWYLPFVVKEAKRIADGKPYRASGVGERVLSVLCTTLNFSDDWATNLREAVARVLANFAIFI